MGHGYSFICKKCRHRYDVHLGIGMMFPRVYASCISDIKSGEYGEEWKSLLLNQENIAVDASKYLYVCKSCGHWKVSYSLSLCVPKEPDKILGERYGDKTRELRRVSYVSPLDLEMNYSHLKSYFHKCDKCGKRMHKADADKISSLPCPKCGTENEKSDSIDWD